MPQVVSQPGFQAIDLVAQHAVALDKQGRVWHWGYNQTPDDYLRRVAFHLSSLAFSR